MKAGHAVMAVLVASTLAAAGLSAAGPRRAASGGGSASTASRELSVEIPGALGKGQAARLTLHVRQGARPVDGIAACLAAVPVFASVEDALDPTPAGGSDLGLGQEAATPSRCEGAMAGVPSGPGTYVFVWEPDAAGRVHLTFTAAGRTLTVPVDVGSAAPDAVALTVFGVTVTLIVIVAAGLRRRWGVGPATS